MSNILICYYSTAGNAKYQDLADCFTKNGNVVLQLNIRGYGQEDLNILSNRIFSYAPDVVFSYNNSLPEELFLKLKCPLLVVDSDNPEMFFQKELLLNHQKDNIYYLLYQSNSRELYKKILGINIKKNYLYFPPSSDFKSNKDILSDINISFIGSNFYVEHPSISLAFDQQFFDLLSKVKKDYYFTGGGRYPEILKNLKYMISGQQRVSYLNSISDLGLNIYSNTNWREEVSLINLEVANCYQEELILTKSDNENLYNRSKISINLSHPQATNSFSWRVPDIMASNSCLLMEQKTDWENMYGKYISKEVKNYIIYKDQYDMRAKCITLLSSNDLRLRCVLECQNAVEKNSRWNHRISEIQELIGIKLLDNICLQNTVELNSVTISCAQNNKTTENKTIENKTRIGYSKILYYSFYIFLTSLASFAASSNKKRIKILNKLQNDK